MNPLPAAAIDAIALLGRVLLSVIFILGGFGKLMTASATQAYIAKAGLPGPLAAYTVSVFVELGVGALLLLGLLTRPAALVLAVWCVVTAALFHSNFADHNMMIHFLKNICMAGGMLYVVAFGGGAYSLDAVLGLNRSPQPVRLTA